eukprot:1947474-Pleurochrysis_carterae.AAC.1
MSSKTEMVVTVCRLKGVSRLVVKMRIAVDRLKVRLGPWKAPRCYQLRAIRYVYECSCCRVAEAAA